MEQTHQIIRQTGLGLDAQVIELHHATMAFTQPARRGLVGPTVAEKMGRLWYWPNLSKTQHASGWCSGAVVDNFNALSRESHAYVASDFWRLSDPRQLVCRFSEEIASGLVWKTGRKKYF